MTGRDRPEELPFWKTKRLDEMTEAEWESVCDSCGRCCLEKAAADDSDEVYSIDVGCELLDPKTGACSDYPNRLSLVAGCFKLKPDHIPDMTWLPPTCGYRRVYLGQSLEWWHPLVSGDPATVQQAGVSAAGRFIPPHLAGPREYHTVEWARKDVTDDPKCRWQTALYGGVNASVPTPFGSDARIDLDLMAAHCFWLLANGCQGLAVLDHAGEAASLAIAERIAILEGLVARGVPASKLLAGIGPAAPGGAGKIAATAQRLGIRGVLLSAAVTGRAMPHEVFGRSMLDLVQQIAEAAFVYLSLAVAPSAMTAGLTALESLVARSPGGFVGIRDEAAGCTFGLSALHRFRGSRFEIYTADDAMLSKLTAEGGAGVIGPGANLLGRLEQTLLEAPGTVGASQAMRAIEAGGKLLRSRPPVPAIKSLIARNTGRSEWSKVRLPLRPPSGDERASLFRAFDAAGIPLQPAHVIDPAKP